MVDTEETHTSDHTESMISIDNLNIATPHAALVTYHDLIRRFRMKKKIYEMSYGRHHQILFKSNN